MPSDLWLREWSRTSIDEPRLRELLRDDALHALTAQGLLQIVHEAGGSGIRAFRYVGRCRQADRQITIVPRLRCDYSPVIDELDVDEARLVRDALGVASHGSRSHWLAEALIRATERYLRIGRIARYTSRDDVTSFPRGRILRPQTLQLWAHGRRNAVVARRRTLRAATMSETALRVALTICEATLSTAGGERGLLVTVRSAIASIPPAAPTPRSLLVDAAREAQHGAPPHVRELFSLVGLVLGDGAALFAGIPVIAVGGALFVDMSAVLERAVRRTVVRMLPTYEVLDGNVHHQTFLESPSMTGEPDIVIRRGSTTAALLDVKDKVVGTSSRADVYQLFSHCAGARAELGILIYLDEAYRGPRSLGVWNERITLLSAAIRPSHLASDIARMLGETGLMAEQRDAASVHYVDR